MKASLDERTQAVLLPRLLAPEIADVFVRTLSKDLLGQGIPIQTHQQKLVRKNAIEIHGRNYAPLLALHCGMTPMISELTGADLLPSFSYFRLYFSDDICRVHSDRTAVEYALSLTLALSDSLPWELSVGTRPVSRDMGIEEDFGDEPYEPFPMAAGDAVLYRGTERRHGRLTPNPNRWSAHAFLMWVSRDGPNRAEAFERLDLGSGSPF
jgi:hypothetical protein